METARHYSKGGAIRHMADGGLVGKIKGLFSSGPKETISERYARQDAELAAKIAARQPKAEPAAAPKAIDGISDYSGMTATQRREKAAGLAKGGPVQGPGTGTSDDIPIMASNGEYMVKAAAVRKLGVAFMNKLNSIADDPADQKTIKTLKKKGAVRKMRDGGLVEEPVRGRAVAPYVNHRAPSGPPVMQEQLRLPNNAPAPGTSVTTTGGYKPNFTMGGTPQQPPPAVDPVTDVQPKGPQQRIGYTPKAPSTAVATTPYKPNFTMGGNPPPQQPPAATDVRAKYDPSKASPEAKAYQAERAANPGPKPAAPSAPKPSAAARAGAAVKNAGSAVAGNRAVSAVARLATPLAIGATAGQTAVTPTEDYETRFGFSPSTIENPALRAVRDVGVRALGAASDLGNVMTGGLAGEFYRDKQAQAQTLTPADTVAQPVAAAPAAPAPVAPVAAAVQPVASAPAPITSAVRRVGNSYSGQNVSGDISINGQAPRGGFVGGTGDGTFTYGGTGGGSGAGGGVSDQALYAARLAAAQRGDVEGIKASYAAQGQDFGPKVDPISALVNNGKPMTVRKAAAIAQLQQQALAQQNSQADRKLAQDKFDLERDGAKLDNKAKAQLASLQTAVLDPNTTPEQRKSALAIYRGLTGKAETQNRYTVVPGGQAIDPATNAVYTKPSTVIDNQTGQFVEQQGQPGAKAVAPPEGTRLQKDGKYFVVKNGVPVPL